MHQRADHKLQLHVCHVLAQTRARPLGEDDEGIFHRLGAAVGVDPAFGQEGVRGWVDLRVPVDVAGLD